MLSVGRHRVATERAADSDRFEWLATDAAAMPLEDASVDVATTCFLVQLVEDRSSLLREIGRVLRPGGILGLVTWIAGDLLVPADEAFSEVVEAFGVDEEGAGVRPGPTTDYVDLDEAREELVASGFADVDVRADELHHVWTRDEYLVFKERFDDSDLFEALDEDTRRRLRAAALERWSQLPDEAFEARGPLVTAIARRPRG
jgi:SAM-dependent methyltransferase